MKNTTAVIISSGVGAACFLLTQLMARDALISALGLAVASMLSSLTILFALDYFGQRTIASTCIGLVLISFSITYPLSAVSHLLDPSRELRGFWDLDSMGGETIPMVWFALILCVLSLVSLQLGIWHATKRAHGGHRPLRVPPRIALPAAFLFIALGVYANIRLFGSAQATSEALRTLDRSSEIGSGLARFYFIARWLPWGAFFLVAYASVIGLRGTLLQTLVLLAISASLANTYWRGGRTEGILAILPILLLVARLQMRIGLPTVIASSSLLAGYIALVTSARSDIAGASWLEVIDWQAGRFSMIGLGHVMVDAQGFAWGSTLLSPILETINAPFRILNLSAPFQSGLAVTNYVGYYVRGDYSVAGIVPGSICELYFNFGVLGVGAGYYLIGRMTGRLATLAGTATSLGIAALSFYSIVLICTSIVPGTCTTWIYYMATMAFPAWAFVLIEKMATARSHSSVQPLR